MARYLSFRDGGKTDEKGISQHLSGLFTGEVINGLAVAQNSPLAMIVTVSKGRCMIDSGSDYPYLGFTDGTESVNVNTADGSNPRIDTLVAYVDKAVVDSTTSNNPNAFKFKAVDGTPAGSPVAPNSAAISSSIGAGNPYIKLANIAVGAGVTTISNGNITDTRIDTSAVLADDVVTTAKIADSAVTSEKLSSTISFRAYNSTASYSFSNTPTVVNFATEVYDTGSDYDGTNKFTAPVDGIYNFSARASREDNTLGYLAIYIYVNGSAYAKGSHISAAINSTGALVSTDVKLSASDYVQAYLQANGSASGNLGTTNALCYFAGHLVGRT